MDFSCMGVGSNMFIRAIAALVAGFKAMPGNTSAPPEALSVRGAFAVNGLLAGVLEAGEMPSRCDLKHGEQ